MEEIGQFCEAFQDAADAVGPLMSAVAIALLVAAAAAILFRSPAIAGQFRRFLRLPAAARKEWGQTPFNSMTGVE